MVIWRTTARTGHALRTRSLSSSAVKAQAIDFSKAVEDFKTNGVAILPLKMEEEYVGKSRCCPPSLDHWFYWNLFSMDNVKGLDIQGRQRFENTIHIQFLCLWM